MLSCILKQTTPAKNARRLHLFVWDNLPTLKRIYPITRLASAHRTFTVGDDNPLHGGCANGEGKKSPDTPWTKCGTVLVKNKPAQKQAT
jgi:hypothetical protein